jgi:trimethylamine:corrinoid methyltransferase-like protein
VAASAKPYPPIEVLSADQVEAILDAALTILETKGSVFSKATAAIG